MEGLLYQVGETEVIPLTSEGMIEESGHLVESDVVGAKAYESMLPNDSYIVRLNTGDKVLCVEIPGQGGERRVMIEPIFIVSSQGVFLRLKDFSIETDGVKGKEIPGLQSVTGPILSNFTGSYIVVTNHQTRTYHQIPPEQVPAVLNSLTYLTDQTEVPEDFVAEVLSIAEEMGVLSPPEP